MKNYRCDLTVLDIDAVNVSWLHYRARSLSITLLNDNAPRIWLDYIKGKTRKLDIWQKQILETDEQLPSIGSADAKILQQLVDLTPTEFEAVTVSLFEQLPNLTHSITRTRPTGDKGFDFFGHFTLPYPVSYNISFLGEAKKFRRTVKVEPKHISRLVARLNRGQYGIFVTTSYYSKQAQEEVLEDGYPVKLFSGIHLVYFLKELRLIRDGQIKVEWLNSIKQELR